MSSGFVHLHVHSHFSFMDGTTSLHGLLERAVETGMPALAITDHQGLYGAQRFLRAAKEAGVRPIIGAEVVVESSVMPSLSSDPPVARIGSMDPTRIGVGSAVGHGHHLTLLVRDRVGYRNLCRLIARAHLRARDRASIVTLDELAELSTGLIGLSGCPHGEVGSAVLSRRPSHAHAAARRLANCFAEGDFHIELMNLLTPDSPRYVASLTELADTLGIPVVATNNVHYLDREDFRLHDVLASAGARMPLPGPRRRQNGELWFKPEREMRSLFSDGGRACDATLAIAERCELDLGRDGFHFPAAEIPSGETPGSVLSGLAWRGVEQRYRPSDHDAAERLRHELSVIGELGFSEYFLIVHEIVEFARSQGIRCSGRGSAGDSIVTYALGITDADPIEHDLLFERFLNPARRQMPDIDIDFDSRRRDEVIDFIYRRFGTEHVAMVATVNTMTARSAVRTVARAFGRPIQEVNALSRHLPWAAASRLPEVLATYPECRGHPLARPENERIVELARKLDRCPLHLGTHLGGFIITRDPIDTWMPLQWAAKGVVISQYDKDDIEALGLVKMDILGLRTHSAISDAVAMARSRCGDDAVPEPFDLDPVDPEVYAAIGRADTVGMFQLESSGQRNLSRRLRATRFEDIIAQISLFRPGPLEAEMITPFIRRRHGLESVTVPHPAMAEPLRDSYGVIVYQEQVLRVAQAVAGFDLAEADSLRRAMTKGRSREEMFALKQHFIARAIGRGVDPDVAYETFRQLEGFAAYGFNKAHAACFAVVSYATAWLKVHYPAEFAAAIMDNQPMGFYSPRHVLNDARAHGIEPLQPHVNESAASYRVSAEGDAVRVGLSGIHAVSGRLVDRIVRERAYRPFRDLDDMLRRTNADAPAAESLIRVGALDGLGVTDARRPPTRDEMLALLPELKAVIAREGVAGDDVLVLAPGPSRPPEDATHVSGWSKARRISAELETLGLTLTCHPLSLARDDLAARSVIESRALADLPAGTRVVVCGLRERAQTPRTRSGRRTCFLTLEDPTGLLDVVVFEDVLERVGDVIVRSRCLLVTGTLQNDAERGLAIIAEDIRPYTVRARGGATVHLHRGVRIGAMGPSFGTVGTVDEGDPPSLGSLI